MVPLSSCRDVMMGFQRNQEQSSNFIDTYYASQILFKTIQIFESGSRHFMIENQ